MYFYVDKSGQQQGPVPADVLISKGVTSETLVWKAGMSQWVKASLVPELKPLFTAPPVPPSPPGVVPPPINGGSTGQVPPVPPSGAQKIDNNMLWAILSTVLCCIPTGVYAIYCSSQVDTLSRMGDYDGALGKASEAKKWAIIGAVVGLVGGFLYSIIMILANM
ncbi:MAG: CD225/dispanin family protein [Bacteroides sp.]|nr:CD225/dispanin family protein [Roseburia sp.]MCM1347036.1 CD225/dispanin family protein [Bacteroides sp.]MCM1420725.1 CD225/dispanin family protein [Bacteroides sp.]